MIERLLLEHDEIEKAWELLAEQLQSPEKITDFDQFQREHLNREDKDFSSKVKAALSADQLTQLGKKLAELRHLTAFLRSLIFLRRVLNIPSF